MATIEELEKLAKQGSIEAMLDLGDALAKNGDIEGKIKCYRKAAEQADKFQNDPTNLNLCLYGKRNLGMLLASPPSDENGYETNPKGAFDIFREIISDYPSSRQAMFTRCDLGMMYYDSANKEYNIPHDAEEGIALIKEWERLCIEAHGSLNDFAFYCFRAGSTIAFNASNEEDKAYAVKLLKEISRDNNAIYEQAQKILTLIQ